LTQEEDEFVIIATSGEPDGERPGARNPLQSHAAAAPRHPANLSSGGRAGPDCWHNQGGYSQAISLMVSGATSHRGPRHYALTPSGSESNCSTANGRLCPAIQPQVVRPRLRAGVGRQWRLVRHGADRAVAPCRPWAQHQLGRGHPLRRAHIRVLRPNTARTLVTQGIQQPLAQLWRGTTWRFVWCAERIHRGSSCRDVVPR
jgi:hypothetical protein